MRIADQRRQAERALEVEVDHAVEELLGHVGQLVVDGRHARVVEQDVDLAESVVDGVDERGELIPAADVDAVGHGLAAGLLGDVLRDLLAVLQLAAGDHHVRALPGDGVGDLLAEAAAAAGDDHDLAGQVEDLVRVTHPSARLRCLGRP
jgi:hypothetical protein